MEFRDRTVFVTGGGSGIGLACVHAFLAEGARVALADRDIDGDDPLLADAGDRLLRLQVDVGVATEIAAAVKRTVTQFGPLDIAVNSAGITGTRLPIVEQADDALDDILAVNVRGIFLAMKYQLAAMLDHGAGSLINIASVFATRTWEGYGLYSASKQAVIGLTRAAALENADKGVRVNAIAPGPIRTPFIGEMTAEREQRAIGTVPMRRLGTPQDVADAVLWLASDRAAFVTGATIGVDGGIDAKLFAG